MKKTFTSLVAFMAGIVALYGQSTFSDNFDSYTLGAYVAQASPQWTTWSNAPGGPEDAQVVNTQASSGAQSIYFNSTAANGGPQDLVLPFGGQYTTGTFVYSMRMRIAANKGAYFNFQGGPGIGDLWVMDAYFVNNGTYSVTAGGATVASGNFTADTWFEFRLEVNLNTNRWEIFMDNVSQGVFTNANNKIHSIDIYPANQTSWGGNGQSQFWVDDVSYTHTPYVLPNLNAGITGVGIMSPATGTPANFQGYVGQSRNVAVAIRNLGTTAITSVDGTINYNTSNIPFSLTGLNIPSLGMHVFESSSPISFMASSLPITVTITNVNGGTDDDPNDNTSVQNISFSVVPAAGKRVLVEEGTGTWCQWCPRGAVYMDYMAADYDARVAPVAVHNGDPMALPTYDGPISSLIPGYPSVVVDRMGITDPLDLESEVLGRLAATPTASILNGAQYDSLSRVLDVSLSYTFLGNADQTWKMSCILTEDGVTGASGYAQSNAYGNNANGPMGGYELLGTVVPAAQMVYDHVARAISPDFEGAAGLTGPVSVGNVRVFNFSFTIPASWDINEMNIIGVLINPNDESDNTSFTSVQQAITNGYVPGTVIVGNSQPVQPDQLVTLYPNPSRDMSYLTLNLEEPTDVVVRVLDVTGKAVAESNLGTVQGAQQMPVYTQNLAKGMYFVQVSLNGKWQTIKLMVD